MRANTKIFISQPMANLSKDEIIDRRKEIVKKIKELNENFIIPETYLDSYEEMQSEDLNIFVNVPLLFLSKSIEVLSKCQFAYFSKGWENSRGCKIEYECAKKYGITIIIET